MTDQEQNALVALGAHIEAAERLVRGPLQHIAGDGFALELHYAAATFRQRFGIFWPTGNDDERDSSGYVAP